ncbi:sirohydrochlorin chelatase [Methanocella sp. MCL-LM]|uniref:sirohydrochlorin chelatase n=1 Tax=Methanocella sp. MCL-LM TaxID=3412035 RepID=UPI003C79211E
MTGDVTDGRPGLLLLSYGDFSEGFLDSPENLRLFKDCLSSYELLEDSYIMAPEHDEVSGMSCRVADRLAKSTDGKVEFAYLGLRRPGIREALYRTVSAGSRTTVFVGGAGLIAPGYTSLVHLPSTLRVTTEENAGLDVIYAPPGINAGVAAELVLSSIGRALGWRSMPSQPAGETPRPREDLGIVVVSAPDPRPALSSGSQPVAGYLAAVKALSDASRASRDIPARGIQVLMSAITGYLRKSGLFSAVEAGFIDFCLPGPEEALRKLEAAGSRQIIVTTSPSLLHRHAYSWETPTQVLEKLKNTTDRNLIYLATDTAALADWVSAMLKIKVLGAEFDGISLKGRRSL